MIAAFITKVICDNVLDLQLFSRHRGSGIRANCIIMNSFTLIKRMKTENRDWRVSTSIHHFILHNYTDSLVIEASIIKNIGGIKNSYLSRCGSGHGIT